MTRKRDKAAALALLKKALKRHGRAETIVTDGMRSYQATMRELGNVDRREMGRSLPELPPILRKLRYLETSCG